MSNLHNIGQLQTPPHFKFIHTQTRGGIQGDDCAVRHDDRAVAMRGANAICRANKARPRLVGGFCAKHKLVWQMEEAAHRVFKFLFVA